MHEREQVRVRHAAGVSPRMREQVRMRRAAQTQGREQFFGVGSSFLLWVLGTQMQTVRVAEHAIFITDKNDHDLKH